MSELEVQRRNASPGLKELREAIPKHCFQPSNTISFAFVVADIATVLGLTLLAHKIPEVDHVGARWLLWSVYGIVQGMVFTGIWILAHECGHGALFSRRWLNNCFGFPLHSILLVPYFSWKYSHSRHHRYANNMSKDTAFVPSRESEPRLTDRLREIFDLGEDTPVLNLLILLGHQLLGWPLYLLFNVTAGEESLMRSNRSSSIKQSHLDPTSDIFSSNEHPLILLTDAGLAVVLFGLYHAGVKLGFGHVALLYFLPYVWMNHWIIAITYLHHTHPDAVHFEASAWSFKEGALETIDRDFGFIGKHVFHGIIEYHVVHHLFPRIPFYHAEEATDSITPLLGENYKRVETSFLWDFWKTFTSCQYVEASRDAKGILVWSSGHS